MTAGPGPGFSLFYFSADSESGGSGYDLLLQGARFADEHGFEAVWTPERHFHRFGGLYPNPALTSAAIAATTRRVGIRAGSVVAPLHHPVRLAEDWAVVDRLSGGRAGIALAPGASPVDFMLSGADYDRRHESTREVVGTLRRLWAGGAWQAGAAVGIALRPVQTCLPMWLSCGGSQDSFVEAGRAGVGVLTHLMSQTQDALRANLARYRDSFVADSATARPHVTLMVHTYVADTDERAHQVADGPLEQYLLTAMSLFGDRERKDDPRARLAVRPALRRFSAGDGLIGSVESCVDRVRGLAGLGVDEIACLVDFGVDDANVLAMLPHLDRLRRQVARGARP